MALGAALTAQRVSNPYFGIIPRSSSLGDPPISVAQLLKPFPEFTDVSLYRNNVGITSYQAMALSIRQRFSRGLSYSAAYTRSKLNDDASSVFDASILTGPVPNAAVADTYNLNRDCDYSAGDIPHCFAASLVWDLPIGMGRAKQPGGLLGALASDWSLASVVTLQSGVPIAVTQANSLGTPASRPSVRILSVIRSCRRRSGRRITGSIPPHSRPRASSKSGPRRATRCGDRRIAM